MRLLIPLLTCLIGYLAPAIADEQYQSPEAFVAEAFGGTAPEPAMLWITGALRDQAKAILEHDPDTLRVRYWRKGARTAWVLDEVGKERPITTGWVVENDLIQSGKVLVYRESRGDEVHQNFFLRQFTHAGLDSQLGLTQHVDGITGATLSVSAMRKMAQLALLYHRQVMSNAAAGH